MIGSQVLSSLHVYVLSLKFVLVLKPELGVVSRLGLGLGLDIVLGLGVVSLCLGLWLVQRGAEKWRSVRGVTITRGHQGNTVLEPTNSRSVVGVYCVSSITCSTARRLKKTVVWWLAAGKEF